MLNGQAAIHKNKWFAISMAAALVVGTSLAPIARAELAEPAADVVSTEQVDIAPAPTEVEEVKDEGVASIDDAGSLAPVATGATGSSFAPAQASDEEADEPAPADEGTVDEPSGDSAIDSVTSCHAPDDAYENSSVGTVHWSNEGNVRQSNNHYATASLNDYQATHYIKAIDFDFHVPYSATVNGVTVNVERKVNDVSGMSPVRDYSVRLVKNNVISGDSRDTDTAYTLSDAVESHGGDADLWDTTLTPSDVNDHDFGVAYSAHKDGHVGGSVTVSVDYICMTVTYNVNEAPTTSGGTFWTDRNTPRDIEISGSDVNGDDLTFSLQSGPSHGTWTLGSTDTEDANVTSFAGTYRPDTNFAGTDTFDYLVDDGHGGTAAATVTVHVGDDEEGDGGPYVNDVVANPPAGTYTGWQYVTLTAEDSSSIHFTTNGEEPTCESGTVFTGPITVEDDTTILAVACYPFDYQSEVGTFAYVINPPPAPTGLGAPLPHPSPLPSVLGVSTGPEVAPRVLGAATCLSALDEPGVVKLDPKLAKRLAGRILLKVQACGEAWYLNPLTLKRHLLPAVGDTVGVARALSLKVTDAQLKQIALGNVDVRRGRANVGASFSGRFLQAPDGSLWYVNPADGKRYSVGTMDELLKVMRVLGLGISNANIAKISVE